MRTPMLSPPLHPSLGKYAAAVADYTAALALDAGNTHALFNRGISHEKCDSRWEAEGRRVGKATGSGVLHAAVASMQSVAA